MAEVKVDFNFQTTLNQKEFSLVTRTLAGHELTKDDEVLALDLNIRLLKLRAIQVSTYNKSSARALEVAEQEVADMLAELTQEGK